MIKHDGDRPFHSYRITRNFYHASKNGIRQLKEPGRHFFDIKDRARENKGIHPTALKRKSALSSRKWDWGEFQASKGTCQKLKWGFNACSEKSKCLTIFSISLVHMIEQMEERFYLAHSLYLSRSPPSPSSLTSYSDTHTHSLTDNTPYLSRSHINANAFIFSRTLNNRQQRVQKEWKTGDRHCILSVCVSVEFKSNSTPITRSMNLFSVAELGMGIVKVLTVLLLLSILLIDPVL